MKLKKPKFWDDKNLSFWSILLFPFSILYIFLFFVTKFKKKKKFKVPIICVGNIYLGGTGKTPLVIELFKILKSFNKNPGIIKKKYDYLYDEISMLKKIGPTFVSKKRYLAIEQLLKNNNDICILDDGFQDFSVHKNFSILCFNERQWIGNGLNIPSGPLRESINAIKRADCIFINGEKNLEIEKFILKKKNIKIFYSKFNPLNINEFVGKKIFAFAGIGNPSNFFKLLRENNLDLVSTKSYPDHFNYSEKELNKLKSQSNDLNAILLTTEKDYIRINDNFKKGVEYLKIDLEIKNKNNFKEFISQII